jgi:hypothetical protein
MMALAVLELIAAEYQLHITTYIEASIAVLLTTESFPAIHDFQARPEATRHLTIIGYPAAVILDNPPW